MACSIGQAFAALPFLEGTVWRYKESKKSFTTMKFTSGSGGYFLFNNYERKFIFTYYYNDGVGTLYRDHDEFRNSRTPPAWLAPNYYEIGRASCRERV